MGWFLVSILLPLLAPIAAMWVFQRLPIPVPRERKSLLAPIKDGQLCWGAVGFCALAMYEIAVPGAEGELVTQSLRGFANGVFVALTVFSAFLAAGGALFPIKIVPVVGRWYKNYQALATSLGLTTLAAGSYAVVHYGLLSS